MAKCVGSNIDWQPEIVELEDSDKFLVDNARLGESVLNSKLDTLANDLLLDIANDYVSIRQSALFDDFKLDCSLIQRALAQKLDKLNSELSSLIHCIINSKLSNATKHRYFILVTYGGIERFQRLLQIVGRLSEIDQKLYNEEHRKLLVSEESIAIHSLTSIWTAIISIVGNFCDAAEKLFNNEQNENEYDFIDELEFATTHLQYSKIYLMDMIITSWIKFNRLIKYEDLANGSPFLCQCHFKTYARTLLVCSENGKNLSVLSEMLPLILDHKSKPSMMTHSARRTGVVPLDPCYVNSNQEDLAYFIVWHLYSVSLKLPPKSNLRPILFKCNPIMESCFKLAMRLFMPSPSQPLSSECFRLSPHQSERFKLILSMLNGWCERTEGTIGLKIQMFKFMDDNWPIFGSNYFNNSDFAINDLTIFQLFTKLFNEALPMYATHGKPAASDEGLTPKERELSELWDSLLNRLNQPKATAQKQSEK